MISSPLRERPATRSRFTATRACTSDRRCAAAPSTYTATPATGSAPRCRVDSSTNDPYCPTLRGRPSVTTELPDGVNAVLEIVVDGVDRTAVEAALRAGVNSACRPGVVA